MLQINRIKKYIEEIPFVSKIILLEQRDYSVFGTVEIYFDGLKSSLLFDFQILPSYPLKSHESESIRFLNKELLDYRHVMEDGSICIHTSHSINLKEKLNIDFGSLKNWIIKYYINKEVDLNYEHVVINHIPLNDCYYSYIFSEVDYSFKKGDFGNVSLSSLSDRVYKERAVRNYLVQSFEINKNKINCQWSNLYTSLPDPFYGLFYFTEDIPAKYGRFIFKNWEELTPYLSDSFLNFLYSFEKKRIQKENGVLIPLFLGYKISDKEIHWQVAIIKIGEFPINGMALRVNDIKTGQWKSQLTNEEIDWALTHNSSSKYFFGRGSLSDELVKKNILIIGIGAIGSMVAKTLAKGGCRRIDIVDYDTKTPENVCRSEYDFDTGITDKVRELSEVLFSASPFVDVNIVKDDYFEIVSKFLIKEKEQKELFTGMLNQYDLIFDCSTDDDLMYILNSLELNCDIINISITNHAKELVCGFYPNIYHFVITQFRSILKNNVADLYSPTGCWSPTFKASYNDINTLVQVAIKHINLLFRDGKIKNNFVIRTNEEGVFNLKIEEF